MAATNKLSKIALSAALIFSHAQEALSQVLQKGSTRVKTLFNFYDQSSSDGNQVYDGSGDESVTAFEPIVFIDHQISEDTTLNAQLVLDSWTAASDTIIDENTGASGSGREGQTRTAGRFGFQTEKDSWIYGASVGYSSEYDYNSLNAAFSVARGFADDNFTLGFGVQYFDDDVGLFRDLTPPESASMTKKLPRDIRAYSLNMSQIFSRTDIGSLTFDFINATGYLESTANSVNVAGVREAEELPESRDRKALTLKWVHALNESSALHTSYRRYWDSWDLSADTLRLAYLKEYNLKGDFYEISLRAHSQDAAKYYQDEFEQEEKYMTSDSDLEDFTSVEGGLFHTYLFEDVKGHDIGWSNGLVYGSRSNGLSYGYIQTGVSFEF